LRCAVWFSNYGLPNNGLEYPYKAQSPVLGTKLDYNSFEDVKNEVDRLLVQTQDKKYSIGQSLYFQLPFFCNPSAIISDWCWDMITNYLAVKKFNVPLATSLESVDPWFLDCFAVIESEMTNIKLHEREDNGS
jgi:hypothetical protein